MGTEKINPGLENLAVAVADLHEDPANARLHGDRNLAAIRASLAEFGQQKPIVVLTNGKVIAGNGTLRAAQALGWERIAAVKFDAESEARAAAFAIADNRTAELATWDETVLGNLLKNIEMEFPDLEITGFDKIEVENLFNNNEEKISSPVIIPEQWFIIITAKNEDEQKLLYEDLIAKGISCRLVIS